MTQTSLGFFCFIMILNYLVLYFSAVMVFHGVFVQAETFVQQAGPLFDVSRDNEGRCVSLSEDGDTLMSCVDTAGVHVYNRNGVSWSFVQYFKITESEPIDEFSYQ